MEYRSIFAPASKQERMENFEDYWSFDQAHSGEIDESKKDLERKRERLKFFKENPVRSKQPLADPGAFYRNAVHLKDDPKSLDAKTLLLTCVYKFARHEWVGITGAWDEVPAISKAKSTQDLISRYHLAEEFCHVRFFNEMFETFHLDKVEWVPLGPFMQRVYALFPKFPELIMSPPAFVTELMGMTFYLHLDRKLEEVFADEPQAKERLRELLYEIMTDELAHIGQRRNFMGPVGTHLSKWMVRPLYKVFFADIPEAKHLFDIDQMILDGLAFDYSNLPKGMLERSWVPSYCKA